ncbi:unnamed protein product, partial [Thlaspi arvense]
MKNSEKLGGSERSESTFWDFHNMAENCKIREIRRNQKLWTCILLGGMERSNWIGALGMRNDTITENMDLWGLEHRPLRMCFAMEGGDPSRGRFYFDKRLTKIEGIDEAIQKGWYGDSRYDNTTLMDCIGRCRREMAQLTKTLDINSRDRIQMLKARLEAETFAEDGVVRILKIKPTLHLQDTLIWRFFQTGKYKSQSGYRFLESLLEIQSSPTRIMPPTEKKLWKQL